MNKILIILLIIWGLSGCAQPVDDQLKLDVVKNQQDIEFLKAEFDAQKTLYLEMMQNMDNTMDWIDARVKVLERSLRVTKPIGSVIEPPPTIQDVINSMIILETGVKRWLHSKEQMDILYQQGEMHEQGTEGELPEQEGKEGRNGGATPIWYWTYTGRD